ncbi:MAG: secretin N-terminal domain-containing protein, partial [Patescibacteria group bacterium]|nr:secretin N-terminal domain-containing protein [Patescibacteria group bacterium]
DTSLVGLRFAVDVRTNSIIATGSVGALTVVEAVLSRLDEGDVRQRKNEVYRLKNSFAPDVATAVNEYLTSKRQVETSAAGLLSAFEQVEREVIVVSEPVSNSLIVSATPKYFDDIARLVEQLDRRPPMAMIQVVIAEVSLGNYDEFGVEMGLQDSILFNRALGTGPFSIPGSLFTNGSSTGGQAATSLSTGQVNSDLSFGGLVLSASSESVTVLIRALEQCQKVRVLSRPQIMTLDNQPAQIVVGEDVPYITGTTFSEYGQQNSISYREVGLILTVTPRVSPDGLVVMEIVATNSKVGPTEDGIPVSVAGDQVIRSPRIQMISAQTVVSALDGQTVVLGGLIVDEDQAIERRVPYLSNIPIAGNLFKYKSNTKERKELLIIMTPRIVEGVEEARQIAEVESARMTWCLRDVEQLHGGYGPDPYFHGDVHEGPRVIYPHLTPTIDMMQEPPLTPMGPEMVPTPLGTPMAPQMQPRPAPQQASPEGNGAEVRFSESPFHPEDRFLEQ